jgi:hypothetical protein
MRLPRLHERRQVVAPLLRHPNASRVTFWKSHYALDRGRVSLRGLHKALDAAVVPVVEDLEGLGRPKRDRGCRGFGMTHGKAVDAAVAFWADSGRIPKNADPCALTAIHTLTAAGIAPAKSQFMTYCETTRVGTAIDLVCVERTKRGLRPLLVELKSTQYPDAFFTERGQFRHIDLPYSAATAALLQAEIPTLWLKNGWGLEKRPAAAVLVVGPGKFARLLRASGKMRAAAARVAGLMQK